MSVTEVQICINLWSIRNALKQPNNLNWAIKFDINWSQMKPKHKLKQADYVDVAATQTHDHIRLDITWFEPQKHETKLIDSITQFIENQIMLTKP